jgi:8-oxo-dGTP pyrophosphatase MutT (NUDIX family)
MSSDILREPFSVEVIIYSKHEKNIEYLLFKRTESRGNNWHYLTGGMKRGESPTSAAIREIVEETGFTDYKLLRYIDHVRCFDIDESIRNKFRGNPNKCYGFCLIVEVDKSEPNLNDEHEDYHWYNYDIARSLLKYEGSKHFFDIAHQLIIGLE